MPMQATDLARPFLLDVCANGSVHIRERGRQIQTGLLPVFSTDRREQAEELRIRHCRRANDGSGLYHLNERPRGVEDLDRVSDLFRSTYEQLAPHPVGASFTSERCALADPGDDEVMINDLREGRGTHHPRVRVLSLDGDGDARCILLRSGSHKTIRVVTLSKAYKLIERNYCPAAALNA